MGDNLEQLIGALNGAVGDYLHRTANGLATPMQLVRAGRPVTLSPAGIAEACASTPTGRVVVLVHGLMSTEIVFRMTDGEDYGSLLAKDFGYTPFYVRYNSGLHISENGEALDALLEALVEAYPTSIEEICLVGHSMGGLVIRSACHAAFGRSRTWLPLARRAIYVGTPHLGAPLERFGNVVSWVLARLPSPYTRLIADLVNLRSSGVKDLRYGSLRREDWEGRDADALLQDARHPVPLLPHIAHYLVAGTIASDPFLGLLFGDAIVPLGSATGPKKRTSGGIFPEHHVHVLPAMDHLSLAHHAEVYAKIRGFCEEAPCSAGAG
jgi:pimeloyl-ACP methyl ester carboxylesterase